MPPSWLVEALVYRLSCDMSFAGQHCSCSVLHGCYFSKRESNWICNESMGGLIRPGAAAHRNAVRRPTGESGDQTPRGRESPPSGRVFEVRMGWEGTGGSGGVLRGAVAEAPPPAPGRTDEPHGLRHAP